ncbi:MAG: hypothetical protein KAR45_20700 [Desulfobacteraceae bacterium]|nr:hypothetical protein [Desulfobacteraceae bacterium]
MFYTKHKSYKFGSQSDLSQVVLDNLISLFNSQKNKKPDSILAGRNSIIKTNISEFGSIIIKQYARGGLIAHFNKDKYLYSKKSRSELEYNALINAKKAEVNVPQPIAHVSKGFPFYQAWLITKEIENAKNFAELCRDKENKAIDLLPEICANIDKLIENSIHHIDLHPGNIIIDNADKPFILDFDKACSFTGPKEKLAEKYKQRWQRAIKKHKLSDNLLNLQLK